MINVTDVSTFTDPVTVLADGDPVNGASSQPTAQALANRARFLKDKTDILSGLQSVISSVSNLALVASSPQTLVITGSTLQTVTMPDATTLAVGRRFTIVNLSSATVVVRNFAGLGGPLYRIPAGPPAITVDGAQTVYGCADFILVANSSSPGTWITSNTVAGHIVGAGTSSLALDGEVGQLSPVGGTAYTSAVTLTTNIYAPVGSASLGPGDFDIFSMIGFSAGTGITQDIAAISLNSTGSPAGNSASFQNNQGEVWQFGNNNGTNSSTSYTLFSNVQVNALTTFYAVARSTFTGGVRQAYGSIWARRAR